MQHDPIVRTEVLAASLGKSAILVQRLSMAGKIPPRDVIGKDRKILGWKLSSIRRWNPAIAEIIRELLESNLIPPAA